MVKRISIKKTPPKKTAANKTITKNSTAKVTAATLSIKQSEPKTTRADTSDRRDLPEATAMARKAAVEHGSDTTTSGVSVDAAEPPAAGKKKGWVNARTLDAMPDRIDVRDWPYQPTLRPLPHVLINIGEVPAILDQGNEGACTGFALAGVINHQLAKNGIRRRVSPRMLYEMARKYDEWPGEDYEGSSARGAMIGWTRHGVCEEGLWPPDSKGANLTPDRASNAQRYPGGAFYRVTYTQVRDMHAALFELGALYMTIMVHDGWDKPGPTTVQISFEQESEQVIVDLPVIARSQHAPDGHAVAIVGYTRDGFIIQNSWGTNWGYRGFALLPYEDFMIHATDVWAAQVGVPVSCDVWTSESKRPSGTTAGLQRAADAIPLDTIRPFVVDCGNNGVLSDSGQYWTTEADVQRLFTEIIPKATEKWARRRVVLYLHGGLNSESDVAKRVVAFKDVFLENEMYPLHIMWESSAMESISDLLKKSITGDDVRSGGIADWLVKARDRLVEAKDRTFELTTARPGSLLWGEMKRNAMLSSTQDPAIGAMQIITKHVLQALNGVSDEEKAKWEFHVVAHSAGSIYFAYAIDQLLSLCAQKIAFSSVNFMAPACTTELFMKRVYGKIKDKSCPAPSLFILSSTGELDDTLGPYGKSLLYLVSNAFEGKRGVPLLGMEYFLDADPYLKAMFSGTTTGGYPALVIAGRHPNVPDTEMTEAQKFSLSESESHGGFDNDPATMNSILRRILVTSGAVLMRPFTPWELQY